MLNNTFIMQMSYDLFQMKLMEAVVRINRNSLWSLWQLNRWLHNFLTNYHHGDRQWHQNSSKNCYRPWKNQQKRYNLYITTRLSATVFLCSVLLIVVCLVVTFLCAIVLSVFLRCSAPDYSICIFWIPLWNLLITPLVSSDYPFGIFWLPLWYLLITHLLFSDYPFVILWLPICHLLITPLESSDCLFGIEGLLFNVNSSIFQLYDG